MIPKLAEVFKALGDPTRLRILSLLSAKKSDICVGALANRLGVTQPAVSQHLKVLKNVGILEANKIGFRVHYRINEDVLTACKINLDEIIQATSPDDNIENICDECSDKNKI